jgi:hypothetical protein
VREHKEPILRSKNNPVWNFYERGNGGVDEKYGSVHPEVPYMTAGKRMRRKEHRNYQFLADIPLFETKRWA